MIRVFTREHADAVADLHLKYLTGLLSDLGKYVVRSFYLGAAESPYAIARVYESGGKVTGFVLGSVSSGKLRKEIFRKRILQTLIGTSLGVLRKPKLAQLMWASRKDRDTSYDRGSAELIYIAVDREQRSGGIGRQLVVEFGSELLSAGVNAYELSVDADNVAAISFYERLGFRKTGQYREFGRDHTRLKTTLGPE